MSLLINYAYIFSHPSSFNKMSNYGQDPEEGLRDHGPLYLSSFLLYLNDSLPFLVCPPLSVCDIENQAKPSFKFCKWRLWPIFWKQDPSILYFPLLQTILISQDITQTWESPSIILIVFPLVCQCHMRIFSYFMNSNIAEI